MHQRDPESSHCGRQRQSEKSGGQASSTTVLAVPLTLTTPENPVRTAAAAATGHGGVGGGEAGIIDTTMNAEWTRLGLPVLSVATPDPTQPMLSESQLVWAAGALASAAASRLGDILRAEAVEGELAIARMAATSWLCCRSVDALKREVKL